MRCVSNLCFVKLYTVLWWYHKWCMLNGVPKPICMQICLKLFPNLALKYASTVFGNFFLDLEKLMYEHTFIEFVSKSLTVMLSKIIVSKFTSWLSYGYNLFPNLEYLCTHNKTPPHSNDQLNVFTVRRFFTFRALLLFPWLLLPFHCTSILSQTLHTCHTPGHAVPARSTFRQTINYEALPVSFKTMCLYKSSGKIAGQPAVAQPSLLSILDVLKLSWIVCHRDQQTSLVLWALIYVFSCLWGGFLICHNKNNPSAPRRHPTGDVGTWWSLRSTAFLNYYPALPSLREICETVESAVVFCVRLRFVLTTWFHPTSSEAAKPSSYGILPSRWFNLRFFVPSIC